MKRRDRRLDLSTDDSKSNEAPLPLKLGDIKQKRDAISISQTQPKSEAERVQSLSDADHALYQRNVDAARSASGDVSQDDDDGDDDDDDDGDDEEGNDHQQAHLHQVPQYSAHATDRVTAVGHPPPSLDARPATVDANISFLPPTDYELQTHFKEVESHPQGGKPQHPTTIVTQPTSSSDNSSGDQGCVISHMPHRLSSQRRFIAHQSMSILARSPSDGRFIRVSPLSWTRTGAYPYFHDKAYHLLNHYYKFSDNRKNQNILIRDLIRTKRGLSITRNNQTLQEQQQELFRQRLRKRARLSDETIAAIHRNGAYHTMANDYRSDDQLPSLLLQLKRRLKSIYTVDVKPLSFYYPQSASTPSIASKQPMEYPNQHEASGYHSYESLSRHRLSISDKKKLDMHEVYDESKYHSDSDFIESDHPQRSWGLSSAKRKQHLESFLASCGSFSHQEVNLAHLKRTADIIRKLAAKNPNPTSKRLQQECVELNPFDIRLRIRDFADNISTISHTVSTRKRVKTNDRSNVVLPPKKSQHQRVQRILMERNMADPRIACSRFLQSLLNSRSDLRKVSKAAVYNADSVGITRALALYKLQSQQFHHTLGHDNREYSIDTVKVNKKGLKISPITSPMLAKASQKLRHVPANERHYRDSVPIIDFFFANHWDNYFYKPSGKEPHLYTPQEASKMQLDLTHQYRPNTPHPSESRSSPAPQQSPLVQFFRGIKAKLFAPLRQTPAPEQSSREIPPRRYTGHFNSLVPEGELNE